MVLLNNGEVAKEDVASGIDVAVELRPTRGAAKYLRPTQTSVQLTTSSARLGSIFFSADDHFAPRMLSRLVNEVLAKPTVRPGAHRSCGFGADLAASSSSPDHVLRAELW